MTAPITVLALDMGDTTGWAVSLNGSLTLSGRVKLKPRSYESAGARYLKLQRWLNELRRNAGRIDVIVLERVQRHAGTRAAHVYGGYLATVQQFAEENDINLESLAVQEIKQWAAGKGNASKEAVKAGIETLGYRPADDNEADALAALFCYLYKIA